MTVLKLPRPGIRGLVLPARGTGLLRFYQDLERTLPSAAISLEFTARPWERSGRQPFAWDYIAAVGERFYPSVRVVAERHVTIRERRSGGDPTLMDVLGATSRTVPRIQIYRPQDDRLVPDPAQSIDTDRIVGLPTTVGPTFVDKSSLTEAISTVSIRPGPAGVVITNINGWFEIVVRLEDPYQPGAFAYQVEVPDEPSLQFSMRLVHSSNVSVSVWATQSFVPSLFLSTALVPLEKVPEQGAPLDQKDFDFQDWPLSRTTVVETPQLEREIAIFLLEAAIGFIPYLGPLYFIGQVAYAAATGEDFWGRKVSDSQLVLMGILAAIPAVKRAPSVLEKMRGIVGVGRFPRLVDPAVLNQVAKLGDPEFLRAVEGIDPEDLTKVFTMLARHGAGEASATQVLEAFNNAVLNTYLDALAQRSLAKVFSVDFEGFSNATLSRGFNAYLAKAGSRKTRDAIGWALAQRGASSYRKELISELGTNYVDILKRARPSVVPDVNVAQIKHYDRWAGRVLTYNTLKKGNEGYGAFYEADHLVEQRFWRNDPRVVSAFDEKGMGAAFLVPKNPAIAARMQGRPILYVHTTKTAMLRELIPNGTEAKFTIQQIYDAHMFVLQSLGVDASVYGNRFRDMFRILVEGTGQRLNFRVRLRSPTAFLPEGGWPDVEALVALGSAGAGTLRE